MKKFIIFQLLWISSVYATPSGWQAQREQGFVSYSAPVSGEHTLMVIALDPLPLQGQTLDAWAQTVANSLTQGYGQLLHSDAASYQAPLWNATHHLQGKNGQALFASYHAITLENNMARMVVMLGSEDDSVLQAHSDKAGKLLANLLTQNPDARTQLALAGLAQHGHAQPQFGGAFAYGHYQCEIENGNHPYRVQFDLYDNGEYRSSARSYETGDYSIDPGFSTVSIERQFNLFNYDSVSGEARHVAVYFHDKNGKAWIYGEDLEREEATLCQYVGNAKEPSPSAEAQAQAEEKRFKWTTAPNEGVAMADIEAILHHVEHKNDSLGIRLEEEHILLLKDGTAYTALRVSPADLDVAASREHESQSWRRWRKENGVYQLEINGRWQEADGQVVRPARRGETLSGAYSHASMHGNIYTSAHTFKDTLYFQQDGTFSSGSTMRGGTTSLNTGTFSANVGSDHKDNSVNHYQFDGYTLIRRYADGSETRSLAYFWGEGQKHLTINGVTYSKD